MRLPLSIGLISTLALGACGGAAGGKANLQDLSKSVIEALAKKDKEAFKGLYVTTDTAVSTCSELKEFKDKLAERFAGYQKTAVENFEKCAAAYDWSKAKPLETKGGELRDPEKRCADMTRVHDLELLVEIDGKKVSLKIADAVRLKGSFFLNEEFECELVTEASAEDKPAEEKPAEDKPAEDKPAEDKPAEDKPAEDKPAEDKPAAAGDSIGNEACDKLIAALDRCVPMMPEAARPAALDSARQMREAWTAMPDKSYLTEPCKQAMSTMAQAMGTFCPGVFE